MSRLTASTKSPSAVALSTKFFISNNASMHDLPGRKPNCLSEIQLYSNTYLEILCATILSNAFETSSKRHMGLNFGFNPRSSHVTRTHNTSSYEVHLFIDVKILSMWKLPNPGECSGREGVPIGLFKLPAGKTGLPL